MSVLRAFGGALISVGLVAAFAGGTDPAAGGSPPEGVWGSKTRLASVALADEEGFSSVIGVSSVSRNGRYVVFTSNREIAPEDARVRLRRDWDVYRADRRTGEVTLVSIAASGLTAGNAGSHHASISDDGRYVAFLSGADDLVERDNNDHRDAFVRDMKTGTTSLVSVNLRGASSSGKTWEVDLAASGRFAVFKAKGSDLVPTFPGWRRLYVRDLVEGKTRILGRDLEGRAIWGDHATISGNGRHVAFQSWQMNLDPRDRNGTSPTDSFVTDRKTGVTELVNLRPDGRHAKAGANAPAISRNGQYVVYLAASRHLDPRYTTKIAGVYRRNLERRRSFWVSPSYSGELVPGGFQQPTISADGTVVAFVARANGLTPVGLPDTWHTYVHEVAVRQTTTASVSHTEKPVQGGFSSAISSDGGHVVFSSSSANVVPKDTAGVNAYRRSR